MAGLHRAIFTSIALGFADGFHLTSEVETNVSSTTEGVPHLMRTAIQADGSLHPSSLEEETSGEEIDEGVDEGLNASKKTKVLMVDMRGPTGMTGDGVRTMGMLMDLKSKACRHQVEVLSDIEPDDLKSSWIEAVRCKKFSGVHLWTTKEHKSGKFNLGRFHRIIIGAKLELLFWDKRSGVAVPTVIHELEKRGDIPRKQVAVYWDDVPFDRCLIKDEAKVICPRVPAAVAKLAKIAHTFYVLSQDDKARMTQHMKRHGIWSDDLVINVWPMRIRNMWDLMPWERFSFSSYEKKDLVTMMGNHHAVNKQMVNHMFEKGIVGHICHNIKEHKSHVKLLFMGGLAGFAKKAHDGQLGKTDMSCVKIKSDYVTDEELRTKIIPRTRAVLNPFFANINSGISVKNFESVMMAVPFITHRWGMHGLSDEFKACDWFPMPKDPTSSTEFQNFFVRNIISRSGYQRFAEKFHTISPLCAHAQTTKYPQHDQCW